MTVNLGKYYLFINILVGLTRICFSYMRPGLNPLTNFLDYMLRFFHPLMLVVYRLDLHYRTMSVDPLKQFTQTLKALSYFFFGFFGIRYKNGWSARSSYNKKMLLLTTRRNCYSFLMMGLSIILFDVLRYLVLKDAATIKTKLN